MFAKNKIKIEMKRPRKFRKENMSNFNLKLRIEPKQPTVVSLNLNSQKNRTSRKTYTRTVQNQANLLMGMQQRK